MTIEPPKMQQNGELGLQFSSKVFLPDFISDKSRRRLISLSEINVQRDVMDVNLVINSDVNPKDIKYFLSITEWNEEGIKVLMNVTTPLLISKGVKRDQAVIRIKNPLLFISQATGEPIDTKNLAIRATLPRMLPKDVDIHELKSKAKTAG